MKATYHEPILRLVPPLLIFVFLMTMVYFAWACSEKTAPMNVKKVCIGNVPCELSALIYIAEAQKYFTDNHLDVTIKDYALCREAADSVLKGEVSIATCSAFDIVDTTLRRQNIQTIATIARYQNDCIVSTVGREIKNITDLKKKRIGLPQRTAAEYYPGRFIDLHGLNAQDVTFVDVDPEHLLYALSGGYVDAVVIRQPYIARMKRQMKKDTAIWPIRSGQMMSWNLVCTDSELQGHPELIRQVLSSLGQAENYLKLHPSEARACIQNRLRLDDHYMTQAWEHTQFNLTFDQPLVQAMEDET